MTNLYEHSQQTSCRKLKCDDLLFVEYTCLPGKNPNDIWSPYSHFAYGVSGRKKWITPDYEYEVRQGDSLYCQKGAHYVHQYDGEGFCVLLFFIPDSFIRETILEFRQSPKSYPPKPGVATHIMKVEVDVALRSFFESVISYFFLENHPSPHLLRLKFKELILQILTSDKNQPLASFFLSLERDEKINLKRVMEENCLFNLSLDEYARLCNRSLSSFKRDFQGIFTTSPGKWLLSQRLNHARWRLLSTDQSVNEIAFHSGFETSSNFIRCFKRQYGLPPLQFRQNALVRSGH